MSLELDFQKKGISYGEIRFAPQLHCQNGLTQEEAVRAVLAGLDRASIESRLGKREKGIGLRSILCCMRGVGLHEANLETIRAASRYLGMGVVAVDLAGAEALYPTSDYEEEFRYARSLGVPFTIHAGKRLGQRASGKRWNLALCGLDTEFVRQRMRG